MPIRQRGEFNMANIGPADLEHIAKHASKQISNTGLSDLLFNHDFTHCRNTDKQADSFWLWDEMAAEFEAFRVMAKAAGLPDVPGVRALAEDFFARM